MSKKKWKIFFSDIKTLQKSILSIEEVFYYAAYIHLVFVKIHPFIDGNGRTARLLEKWFLASKLGATAWYIESEKNYFKKRASYYKNVHICANYYTINYDLCLDFLLMLPKSL
jgi:Fic family protein